MKMQALIFQKEDPKHYYAKLKEAQKSWLLRESREPGMLSLDYYDKETDSSGSRRFAFLPRRDNGDGTIQEAGWHTVTKEDLTIFRPLRQPVDLDSADIERCVKQLLVMIKGIPEISTDLDKGKIQLDPRLEFGPNMLVPTEAERTRNDLYGAARSADTGGMSESDIEALNETFPCPITHKSLLEIDDPVYLDHFIYERKELVDWLRLHRTDPMTRAPKTVEDIKECTVVDRLRILLMIFRYTREEAEDKLATQPDGQWLVRPSLSVPGGLEVSYKRGGKIEHALYYFMPNPEATRDQRTAGRWMHFALEKVDEAIKRVSDDFARYTDDQLLILQKSRKVSNFRVVVVDAEGLGLGLDGEDQFMPSEEERFNEKRDYAFVADRFPPDDPSLRLYGYAVEVDAEIVAHAGKLEADAGEQPPAPEEPAPGDEGDDMADSAAPAPKDTVRKDKNDPMLGKLADVIKLIIANSKETRINWRMLQYYRDAPKQVENAVCILIVPAIKEYLKDVSYGDIKDVQLADFKAGAFGGFYVAGSHIVLNEDEISIVLNKLKEEIKAKDTLGPLQREIFDTEWKFGFFGLGGHVTSEKETDGKFIKEIKITRGGKRILDEIQKAQEDGTMSYTEALTRIKQHIHRSADSTISGLLNGRHQDTQQKYNEWAGSEEYRLDL